MEFKELLQRQAWQRINYVGRAGCIEVLVCLILLQTKGFECLLRRLLAARDVHNRIDGEQRRGQAAAPLGRDDVRDFFEAHPMHVRLVVKSAVTEFVVGPMRNLGNFFTLTYIIIILHGLVGAFDNHADDRRCFEELGDIGRNVAGSFVIDKRYLYV